MEQQSNILSVKTVQSCRLYLFSAQTHLLMHRLRPEGFWFLQYQNQLMLPLTTSSFPSPFKSPKAGEERTQSLVVYNHNNPPLRANFELI